MKQFEQTLGVVENIDKTSRQLKQALEDGKTIIVSTLQKFPVIVDEIGKLPGKRFAVIIDEAHSSEPYYDRTVLREGTDPNLLYDIQTHLEKFHLYDQSEVDRFAEIFFSSKGTQDKLHGVLAPVVDRFKSASNEDKAEFRGHLTDFVRLYAFLSQVIPFADPDLEKLYIFSKLLSRKLPASREKLPVEIQENTDNDKLQEMTNSNFKFYKQVTDDQEFAKVFFSWLFERYLGRTKKQKIEGN